MLSFDRFVAIDWTGARPPVRSGIAVAIAEAGNASPRLLRPRGGGVLTRTCVVEWLVRESRNTRMLVGFDFAFSLPFARASTYFDHGATAFELWALIDRVSDGEPDFFGGTFAVDPRFAPGFWARGPRPEGFELPHRATELACHRAGLGAPESPYKLVGAKQVGKGSLAGMRVLHHLRRRHAGSLSVWPFEPHDDGRSVLAEIYPRLFLRRAGMGNGKVRDRAALARALEAFDSRAPRDVDASDDHATDALVAAAGLRHLAAQEAPFTSPRADPEARLREGWILGVPRFETDLPTW